MSTDARHSTHTAGWESLGPEAAALSTRIVSRAVMSLTATMNRPVVMIYVKIRREEF